MNDDHQHHYHLVFFAICSLSLLHFSCFIFCSSPLALNWRKYIHWLHTTVYRDCDRRRYWIHTFLWVRVCRSNTHCGRGEKTRLSKSGRSSLASATLGNHRDHHLAQSKNVWIHVWSQCECVCVCVCCALSVWIIHHSPWEDVIDFISNYKRKPTRERERKSATRRAKQKASEGNEEGEIERRRSPFLRRRSWAEDRARVSSLENWSIAV